MKALEDLDALRNTLFWVELPPSWELDFAQLADEMRLVRHRIASNLGLFRKPSGWEYLLSFV
ncbi:MAG: hypothetical protein IPK15_14575 [Verrucomicrobia bacterium]|nr:hypothetical protein [Verrucomicrobiota bacterium]